MYIYDNAINKGRTREGESMRCGIFEVFITNDGKSKESKRFVWSPMSIKRFFVFHYFGLVMSTICERTMARKGGKKGKKEDDSFFFFDGFELER